MIQTLLDLDRDSLIWARGLVGPEYAQIIQITGEIIVLWWALLLVGLWLYGVYRKENSYKIHALEIFSIIIITFLLYTLINFGIEKWRPSPGEVVWTIAPLIPHPLDNSFPSGHSLFMTALFIGIFFRFRNWWIIAITLIIGLMTVSARVIGGVHYPWDILGGWIFGSLGGYIGVLLIKKSLFQKHIFPFIIRLAHWFKL